MKAFFKIFIPVLFLGFLYFLFGNPGKDYDDQKIITGYGPEDMALDISRPDFPRILISCSKRKGENTYGKIQSFDIKTGIVSDMMINGYDTKPMRPHGINLVTIDSVNYFYVISHERQENDSIIDKILKFELITDELIFNDSYTSDEFHFMDATNDLVVTEEGNIYCTNPTKVGFSEVPAVVGMIRPDRSSEIVAEGLLYPNGIYKDGNHLFVATAQQNTLFKYELDNNGLVIKGSRFKAAQITGGDNITKYGDYLIIANHPNLYKFVLHSMTGLKSPSSVYAYNLSSGESKQIYGPSSADISASSTALIYDDFIYISQVFENYIVKIPLAKLDFSK